MEYISLHRQDPNFQLPMLYSSPNKRLKINGENRFSTNEELEEVYKFLPIIESTDYYIEPCLKELVSREILDPGYCTRVQDFTVGRIGYGHVKFSGETDIRRLDLERIVKLKRHEIIVYDDESKKPAAGEGLNKPAEVTLTLQLRPNDTKGKNLNSIVHRLKQSADRQGAKFISFDLVSSEWKFMVQHFSRFGLTEDDEEDIVMEEADAAQEPLGLNRIDGPNGTADEFHAELTGTELAHSLPAHLGLDPIKMKEMKMVMFSHDDEEEDNSSEDLSHEKEPFHHKHKISPIHHSYLRSSYQPRETPTRKTPLALLEYNSSSFDVSASGAVLMSQENKGLPLRSAKAGGFMLDSKRETPVARYHSHNIVDAALFMGRSFRVGWGPNGILVHSGTPITGSDHQGILSSMVNIEKVAVDKVARDESNKVQEDAIHLLFDSALDIHRSLNHKAVGGEVGSFSLSLQKVILGRTTLPVICQRYVELVEKQLELPGLSTSLRMAMMHQVMIWELIKVLFSAKEISGQSTVVEVENEEDMMQDSRASPPEIDQETLPLVRRAEFSYWLQESVYHRVQEDLSSLDDSNYLEHIFLLLTGKQLDAAVELAASKRDVRLACLLSQAGGSMLNRSDISEQLNLWRINGMDFNFVEKDRIRLYELLAGNILVTLDGRQIDWKRFLGLLMWYKLPPGIALPSIFQTYQRLLAEDKAPYPVPVYIDEGPASETFNGSDKGHCDLAYHLMLLHAGEPNEQNDLKSMFSAFASTNDPLDYHMIWHQREILEAIDAFSSNDLHVLDMGYVSQLLYLGLSHWAIYVVLHMAYHEDFPDLHFKLIKEILFQYCETWSMKENQRQFIEDLGVPSAWMHEAMAVYFQYHGDLPKALEHFVESESWQKAHLIFVTSVAHLLFLAGEHSEVWRLATSLDDHKSEIEDWDLGAGIYISFYLLRSSLKDEDNAMRKLDSLESKDASCAEFFGMLDKSLVVLGSKLTTDTRVVYSKMAEEISSLLISSIREDSSRKTQWQCFDTVACAPIPEDLRSSHLQDAISLFTCFLSEEVSS